MITPHFTVSQDSDFVTVVITAPHIRAQNVDFYVEGPEFKFHLHPYFLRLRFPGNLIEDSRTTASYDIASGKLTAVLPKETPGEVFPDLDLLSRLLACRGESEMKKPLIEMIGEGDVRVEDGVNFDWEVPQEISEELGTGASYGFGGKYGGYLVHVQETGNEVNEIEDPERSTVESRRQERVMKEDAKFDEEYYVCDLMNSEEIKAILKYKTTWSKEMRRIRKAKEPEVETLASSTTSTATQGIKLIQEIEPIQEIELIQEVKPIQKIEPVKEENSRITSQMSDLSFSDIIHEEPINFTTREQEIMLSLPRREYILENVKSTYLGLVDILFAYCYNHRVTEGENTVESVWTVGKLSSTISCLEQFPTLKDVVIACYRRALAYPLYRNFELCDKVLQDVYVLFKLGRRPILKALLELKDLFDHHDVYYVYSKIWLDDYCVWVQGASERVLRTLAHELHHFKVVKVDVGWELEALEQITRESQLED